LTCGIAAFVAARALWGRPGGAAVAGGGTLASSDNGTDASGSEASARFDSALIGALAVASAAVIALAGRDMFTTVRGDIDGQGLPWLRRRSARWWRLRGSGRT
jgi:hypothetical protein